MADNIDKIDYSKPHKWVFEKEIKLILAIESKNMQRSWGSRIKKKAKGAAHLIRLLKLKTINNNEMICLKINSFYKITSVGLNGRVNWEKIAKYKKSIGKNADCKKKKEQVKWCARDSGRSSKSTGRITGGNPKGAIRRKAGSKSLSLSVIWTWTW